MQYIPDTLGTGVMACVFSHSMLFHGIFHRVSMQILSVLSKMEKSSRVEFSLCTFTLCWIITVAHTHSHTNYPFAFFSVFAHSLSSLVLFLSLFPAQSSKSAADRKALSRPGGGLEGEMSGQGGIGDSSDLPRGGGSGGGPGSQLDMELGPSQGECLMGAGEVDDPPSALLSRKTAIMSQFESKALGLDKAILHSIDCCGKETHEGGRLRNAKEAERKCVRSAVRAWHQTLKELWVQFPQEPVGIEFCLIN